MDVDVEDVDVDVDVDVDMDVDRDEDYGENYFPLGARGGLWRKIFSPGRKGRIMVKNTLTWVPGEDYAVICRNMP